MDEEKPKYKVYRSRPRLFRRGGGEGPREGLDDLREGVPRPDKVRRPLADRFTFWRVIGYLALAATAWILLSLLLFLISAQLQRDDVTKAAGSALDPAGYTLSSPNTILVLGSDARTKGSKEPGANVGGPSRSDTILLMRVGGGRAARLSIPRDTIADIPGHGRDKINAAYAFGGPALAIQTVKAYLGIEVNHVVEVNFANFPDFIDSLGGINYKGGCVVSKINGGFKNGGYTLRLRRGTNHLDGKQALALARTRKNECNVAENDLSRARRQQKILSAIKNRLISPATFLRLPFVSWQAPKAVRSDMAGPSLLGLFGSVATSGSPRTRVLRGSPQGTGLVVPDDVKRREVARFLRG
jgi:LCP family protein required for cell wall assembly